MNFFETYLLMPLIAGLVSTLPYFAYGMMTYNHADAANEDKRIVGVAAVIGVVVFALTLFFCIFKELKS